MTRWWSLGGLLGLVAILLVAARRPAWQRVFRWLPIPLWCYAVPIIAITAGWLPRDEPLYRAVTDQLLPFALALLLLGVDLPGVLRAGTRALLAALIGAAGIMAGCAVWVRLLRADLPAEAWKGAGTLAATWTGGSTNLLALRGLLDTPDEIFAPLVIVDALVAYTWMALLVAGSGWQGRINRWLRTDAAQDLVVSEQAVASDETAGWAASAGCAGLALGLAVGLRTVANWLPTGSLVGSASGWTILLVTTAALILSLFPAVRRLGAAGARLGYPSLYLVLAATGAQASLAALRSAPVWIVLGFGVVVVHGAILLGAGRLLRLPVGILATASQSNIGGFVSGPLVGAVYHRALAPVGLLLAMAGSALGTYAGLATAWIARLWLPG